MGVDERAALKNNQMGMRKADQSNFLFLLFFFESMICVQNKKHEKGAGS